MIYIIKNTTNKVALELSCILPTDYEYFLFEFIYEGNLDRPIRYYTTADISVNKQRYNLFEIIESNLGSITTNNINPIQLEPGQYNYNIYANDVDVDFNDLTPFLNNGIISSGKMVVEGNNNTINSVYDSSIPDTTSNSVYD